MRSDLIAYAGDFVSFLIQDLGPDVSSVKQIILFGSVPRGNATKGSDVDLFVDVCKTTLEGKIQTIRDKFYDSSKVKTYWSLLAINNEINCTVGRLEEWDNLKRSLISDGIILYGKYSGVPKTVQFYLFIVTPSNDRNKNLSVWRSLYGYRQKVGKKIYEKKGVILERSGTKLARGVFMIPAQSVPDVSNFLRKNRFRFKVIPFWQEAGHP